METKEKLFSQLTVSIVNIWRYLLNFNPKAVFFAYPHTHIHTPGGWLETSTKANYLTAHAHFSRFLFFLSAILVLYVFKSILFGCVLYFVVLQFPFSLHFIEHTCFYYKCYGERTCWTGWNAYIYCAHLSG